MTVVDIVQILRRRWMLALLPLALILMASLAFTPAANVTTYAVGMRFSAGLPPEPRHADAYNYDSHYNWLASEYITRALAQAVETGQFAQNLSKRLQTQGLIVPVGAIRSEYLASYMKVTVVWPDAAGAVTVAQALVDELNQNSAAYWPQLTGATVSPVRLLDEPVAVAVPPPLRSRFDLPVRVALGVLAGLLLAFVAHALDPLLRARADLDRMGLPVLAEIVGIRGSAVPAGK